MGNEFWKQLCAEHGIGKDGTLLDKSANLNDRKDKFFYQVPGSFMVHLIL